MHWPHNNSRGRFTAGDRGGGCAPGLVMGGACTKPCLCFGDFLNVISRVCKSDLAAVIRSLGWVVKGGNFKSLKANANLNRGFSE